ncbi:MAG TPA: PasA protein, partial [Pseudomonas sp.]|nr:PasA protein [Pseudomonas sp.]
ETDVAPLSREELESWRKNLKDLTRRFREALSEC